MSDMIYRPLIEGMTWSYSRIECFNDCPYRWFMKYIKDMDEEPQFYASYGTFMHKLIEMFHTGEASKDDLPIIFLTGFSENVQGARPKESIVQGYIDKGLEYLKNIDKYPYDTVAVEKKIDFEIEGNRFTGIIDYIGEKDGELYIVDNKSRDLKPRSNRKKPTQKDMELDEMLRQLYIYSEGVRQEYGKFPRKLIFNCFKAQTWVEEDFNDEKYNEAIGWATRTIERIKNTTKFYCDLDFFKCFYLCGLHDECCYWEMR